LICYILTEVGLVEYASDEQAREFALPGVVIRDFKHFQLSFKTAERRDMAETLGFAGDDQRAADEACWNALILERLTPAEAKNRLQAAGSVVRPPKKVRRG
jgi:hypothetical protein